MVGEYINQVINSMPFPVWIKGLDKRIKYANQKFDTLHKIDLHKNEKAYDQMCDSCKLKIKCNEAIDRIIKGESIVEFEVTIHNKINKCYINKFFDNNEKLIGVMGMIIDISSRIEHQRQLEEREHILRTIIDTIPDYIFYKDKDCRYIGYNKKWKDFYNKLGIDSMIGKNDFESGALPNELAQKFVEEDKYIMNTKKIKISERKIVNSDGSVRIEETTKVPVISGDGKVWGIVGLASDVTEKIELKEKLIKLSYTDSLTQVYNRACFEEKINELNKEEYLPIGVIMGDVNGLKLVNDTFGHLEGDKLLIEITNILKLVANEEDYIFRWGGDEFVILMPNCNEVRCEQVIANIIEECKKSQFNLIEMSISLGASIKNKLNIDIYENLKEAEEKLYRQKFLKEKSIRSSMILSLCQSLHEKNVETQAHTQRLIKHAIEIGKKLGFTIAQLDELELVTKLHDVGKIGVSEDILLKKQKLNDEEFKMIKSHTEKGYRILQASNELSHVARGVLTHHERYDGCGYPLGLSGEEIPIMARIVNVVDSYDAMTNDRGYNKIKSKKDAIKEIEKCKGSQFDPNIADIFINILKQEQLR
ncbi:MAG: HD domain-containing phosphohydrolase [Paraclostridium sp.]|uniref:HD domain-containing phosphohydrolase n=1 Tax=Paraclostridium sp. TaxID=2023273 RepID=UPI003F386C6F